MKNRLIEISAFKFMRFMFQNVRKQSFLNNMYTRNN